MATWRFSDGTEVRSGGNVDGPSAFAADLRGLIADAKTGRDLRVTVAPEPGGWVPLKLKNDWLLDRWLRQRLEWWNRVKAAPKEKLALETEYDPDSHTPPKDAKKLIDAPAVSEADAVY